MAEQTPNLGLTKPARSELYDVAVTNENMDKIDSELGGVTSQLAQTSQQVKDIAINVKMPPYNATGNADGGIEDTTAIQSAITYAESIGAKILIPAGYTYLIDKLIVNNPLLIQAEGAIFKQKAGATGDFFTVNGKDVRIDGLKIVGDASNTTLDGLIVNGDNVKLNNIKTDGFFYSVDVTGDYCEINQLTSENSLYGSCRLNAMVKKLNKFTLNNFVSINSKYKNFVYNGTKGIRDIIINDYEVVYTLETFEDAHNGFLTDSDPDSTLYHVDRLILNRAYIKTGGSGAFKILNCKVAYLNDIDIDTIPTYPSSYGIRSSCKELYVNNVKIDDRIFIAGNAKLNNIEMKYNANKAIPNFIEVSGWGESVEINGLNCTEGNITTYPIRIDRTANVEHILKLSNVLGKSDLVLVGVTTMPPNSTSFLKLDGEVYGYKNLTSFSGHTDRIVITDVKGVRTYYMSSIPTSGSYNKSDRVYNTSPTAGGYLGWVCTKTGTTNNTAWIANTTYTVGQKVNANGKVYECTVAGTSGTVAPSHTTGEATDGTVTWKYIDILAIFKGFGLIEA